MTKLTRRGLGALLAATALSPALARAALPPDKQDYVRKVEAYLNSIHTLQGRFRQINPDGGSSSGTVYVDRDRGAMRFTYDPPSKIELIAPGDWRIIFMDAAAKQVNVLRVKSTPLGFLLNKDIRLSGDLTVTDVTLDRGEIVLTIVRTGQADQGQVRLAFAERPIELRRWMVTDPQGQQTVVMLENIQLNRPIASDVFVYHDPQVFGWPNGRNG
jgi:outer membrane lipoprotein-sorting protein